MTAGLFGEVDRSSVAASGFNLGGILAAASRVTAGGTVLLRAGVWDLDLAPGGTLNAQMGDYTGIKITGAGPFATVLRKRTPGIAVELTGFGQEISNLTIDGSTTKQVTCNIVNGSAVISGIAPALDPIYDVGAFMPATGPLGGLAIQHVDPTGTSAVLTGNASATLNGLALTLTTKGCTTGIMVRGRSATTPQYKPVRLLEENNLYIKGCREGVRFGHYSTLNGVAGDLGDADIAGQRFHNIWLEQCDYGWIEDGQNILLQGIDGFYTNSITYNHILQPRGGQANIRTGYLGPSIACPQTTIAAGSNGAVLPQATVNVADSSRFPPYGVAEITTAAGVQRVAYTGTAAGQLTGCEGGTGAMATGGLVRSTGFPKVDVGAANCFLSDVRSENLGPTNANPPAIANKPGNGTSQVTTEACYWTNLAVSPATNVDIALFGGSLKQASCLASGQVMLKNVDLKSDVSLVTYRRLAGQDSKNESIVDFGGVNRTSAALGRTRIGNNLSETAYAPASGALMGSETIDNALGLVGPVAPLILFYIAGSTPGRAGLYVFGAGGAGAETGLMAFQTKPAAGGLRDVAYLHDALAAGETALTVLCNDAGVFTLKRISEGVVDSGGAGFRFLRVPN